MFEGTTTVSACGIFGECASFEYCSKGRKGSTSRNTTPITQNASTKRQHGSVLLHHSVECRQRLARCRNPLDAVRVKIRSQALHQTVRLQTARRDTRDQMVLMHLRPRARNVVISAIPTLPLILRMRLKMLVAFPILSGEMRDMAGDISGMKRRLRATPCSTCGQQMSQNPAYKLRPERSNIVIEPKTIPTTSSRRGSVLVVRCPANGVKSSAPIPRGERASPEL